MRHVREHFSTELMLQEDCISKVMAKEVQQYTHGIAAIASNHSAATASAIYSGVFERNRYGLAVLCQCVTGWFLILFNSIGGLRMAQVRDKLAFSRKYNQVVLGFTQKTQPPPPSIGVEKSLHSNVSHEDSFISQGMEIAPHSAFTVPRNRSFADVAERLNVELWPFQLAALTLLSNALPTDTKLLQAPTSVGKDLIPFAMAIHTGKAQIVFVPYVALIGMIVSEGLKYRCYVVKYTDIGKGISLQSAAASADVIVLSYEHAPKAIRLAQELESRNRLGWCFFNEAHVAVVDSDFRDFHGIQEIATYCPQVCCMTATLQPHFASVLTETLGRPNFSNSIMICPERQSLSFVLKLTTDTRQFIAEDLILQEKDGRAIVFCLFKNNVPDMAKILRSKHTNREIFECISGAMADLEAFAGSASGIMVCTSILSTGVSFKNVTRIYFLDGAHGPESLLQGAGRGARSAGERCVATLVTSKRQLEYMMERTGYIRAMAGLIKDCIDGNLDFALELYSLFEHESVKRRLFKSPCPKPHQHGQFNVLCQSGEDHEVHAQKPCMFEAPIRGRLFQSPSPMPHQQSQFNVLCHSGEIQEEHAKRSCLFEAPIARKVPCQPQVEIEDQKRTKFINLARSILATRKVLACPDMAGRCEGRICFIFFFDIFYTAHVTLGIQVVVVGVRPSQFARC
jgi:hypothetical protein